MKELENEKKEILKLVEKDAYERGLQWAQNIKNRKIKLDLTKRN